MTYDKKCYALAKSFLGDVGIVKESAIDQLAQRIQKTIESFIADSGWYQVVDDHRYDLKAERVATNVLAIRKAGAK